MGQPNPAPTLLDQNQIFQRSFDEENDRLRVDASVNASIGTVECIITQDNDSIAIGDGSDLFTSTAVGSKHALDVNVTNPTTSLPSAPNSEVTTKFKYNAVPLIASGAETVLLTYTVPANTQTILQRVFVSGENIAKYTLFYNSEVIATKRTYYTYLNENFDFIQTLNNGFLMVAGDVFQIKVLQTQTGAADYESTLQILELI